LGAVETWTALTTGVKAVGKRRIPLNDGSTAVIVLSASANVDETAMEIVSGTGNTVSATETLNGTETDASVSGNATGNETATETAKGVIGTDGTKRIAIEKAGRNGM